MEPQEVRVVRHHDATVATCIFQLDHIVDAIQFGIVRCCDVVPAPPKPFGNGAMHIFIYMKGDLHGRPCPSERKLRLRSRAKRLDKLLIVLHLLLNLIAM